MKKASQAAGRPIRTLEDRGSMVFLDDRFSMPYCQRFLPLWIRNSLRVLPDEDGVLAREICFFFKRAF
jgi:Rad3-related DNA helicase